MIFFAFSGQNGQMKQCPHSLCSYPNRSFPKRVYLTGGFFNTEWNSSSRQWSQPPRADVPFKQFIPSPRFQKGGFKKIYITNYTLWCSQYILVKSNSPSYGVACRSTRAWKHELCALQCHKAITQQSTPVSEAGHTPCIQTAAPTAVPFILYRGPYIRGRAHADSTLGQSKYS